MLIAADTCCCPNTIFGIAIFNVNALIDDNFDVYLNGTLIGSIDNSIHAFTGRLWSPSESDFTPAKFGPLIGFSNAFQPTLHLNTALLINGLNTLSIHDVFNNGNGNLGAVRVGNWKLGQVNPGYYDILLPAMLDTTYSSPTLSGPGTQQDFTFTYP